jgi:quinol monooxygenase YgiN
MNTEFAKHNAPEAGTRLTTLDPSADYATTINAYQVTPERAEEVLAYLVRSAAETVRYVPGFLSFNFHVSRDRTQIVNYGQWRNRETVAGARENPKLVALLSETAKIAGNSMPIQYELRQSIQAATATRARLTTLDPSTGDLTLINTYAVHPGRAEELLDFLAHSTVETIRYVPGFISANPHVNFDRTQVVNYAQWKSSEATAAARENLKVSALMREQLQIADSFTPIPYDLRNSVAAADE